MLETTVMCCVYDHSICWEDQEITLFPVCGGGITQLLLDLATLPPVPASEVFLNFSSTNIRFPRASRMSYIIA